VIQGAVFEEVALTHPRTARYNGGDCLVVEARLRGRRALEVTRRGKFLVIPLDDYSTMVAHLGMSGRFMIDSDEKLPHTHFWASLDNGHEISFVDPRTFGFIAVYDGDELESSGVSRLGPDAWDGPPDVEALAAALENRRAPIKALLLDQGPISGLGNIYADEALFIAGIDPRTESGAIGKETLGALLDAIHTVLEKAIANGGTSLDDLTYLLPDGRAGDNLESLQVYGRDGQPCLRCGDVIDKVTIRARSTHFCPHCQGQS
jgi:formamidopyrimidine-DNA glycosylase